MIGEVVGHYRILEKLGGGGMGIIYKALDVKLDRHVALKFLPPIFSMNEDSKRNIINEAKIAATLDHPNICTIHEVGETDEEQIFIAMSYYEGETLKRKIKKGKLGNDEIENIIKQIAKGLSAAHEKGIVHKDIKPDNIFITKSGNVKILDFGVAEIEGDYSVMDAEKITGTISYMSPEQITGQKIDHRSDIWSFGVLIYELVTGSKPFGSQYEQTAIYSILNDDPDISILSEFPDLDYLNNLVSNCLVKDKNKRIQSFYEITSIIDNQLSTGKVSRFNYNSILRTSLYIIPSIIILFILLKIFGGFEIIPNNTAQKETIAIFPINQSNNDIDNLGVDQIQSEIVSKLTGVRELSIFDYLRLNESLTKLFGPNFKYTDKELTSFLKQKGIAFYLNCQILKTKSAVQCHFSFVKSEEQETIFTTVEALDSSNNIQEICNNVVSEITDYFQIKKHWTNLEEDMQPWLKHGSQNMASLKSFLTASQYNYHGERELAEKYLRNSIRLDSLFISPRIWLIITLSEKGSITDAEHELSLLKKLTNKASLFELAMVDWVEALMTKDYYNEIKHLKIALEYFPQNNMLLYNLARVYALLNEYNKCISVLNKTVEEGWQYSPAHFVLGLAYFKIGDLDQAEDVFINSLNIEPVYYDIYYMLAFIYFEKEDTTGGRKYENQYISRALEAGLLEERIFANLGSLNYYLDYFDQSVKYYKKAVEQNNENAENHFYLADSYLEVKDTNNAIIEFEKAVENEANYYEPNYNLANIYAQRKEYEKALQYYKNCLLIDPSMDSLERTITELEARQNKLVKK